MEQLRATVSLLRQVMGGVKEILILRRNAGGRRDRGHGGKDNGVVLRYSKFDLSEEYSEVHIF